MVRHGRDYEPIKAKSKAAMKKKIENRMKIERKLKNMLRIEEEHHTA
jgi:hypothetical protein